MGLELSTSSDGSNYASSQSTTVVASNVHRLEAVSKLLFLEVV